MLQFGLGPVEVIQVEQGAAQGDVRREIRRMPGKARPADRDSLGRHATAPILFGQRRKRDRHRVQFDPSPKLAEPGILVHQFTTTERVVDALLPELSVTVRMTLYVPTFATSCTCVCPYSTSPSP